MKDCLYQMTMGMLLTMAFLIMAFGFKDASGMRLRLDALEKRCQDVEVRLKCAEGELRRQAHINLNGIMVTASHEARIRRLEAKE